MKNRILILSIVLGGFLLRVIGIKFGLPAIFHFDEQMTLYTVFYAASNKLMPDQFLHTMIYPYVLIFFYGIYFLFGVAMGYWGSTFDFFVSYLKDPTNFLIIGRFFNVTLGAFTVWFIYKIGKRFFNKRVGIVASVFLATSFLAVQESHYVKEDVAIGCLGLILYYFICLLVQNKENRGYTQIGILFGILASVKYNFFIYLPMIYLGIKSATDKVFSRSHLKAFLIAGFVFIILNPYVFVSAKKAYGEIVGQASLSTIQWVSSEGLPIWLYNITYYLRLSLGLPTLLVSIIGLIYLSIKIRNRKYLLLITTPIAFFITLAVFKSPNFSRYLVWVLPFIYISVAIFLDKFIKNQILLFTLVILLVYPSFNKTLKFDYYLSRKDTRNVSRLWIEENIPQGTKIVNEGAARSEYSSIWGPALLMDSKPIQKRIDEVASYSLPATYLKALYASSKGRAGFDLLGTIRLDKTYNEVEKGHDELQNTNFYKNHDYCYLVSSSWATLDVTHDYSPEFKRSLEENYEIVKVFRPNPEFSEDYIWRTDFGALDKVKLFDKDVIPGPEIKVYKLRGNSKCYLKN